MWKPNQPQKAAAPSGIDQQAEKQQQDLANQQQDLADKRQATRTLATQRDEPGPRDITNAQRHPDLEVYADGSKKAEMNAAADGAGAMIGRVAARAASINLITTVDIALKDTEVRLEKLRILREKMHMPVGNFSAEELREMTYLI